MHHLRKYACAVCGLLLLLSGCQSLDDDSVYEIKTRASFFLVQTPSNALSIYKYANHSIEADWNAKVGVPNAELSDVEILDDMLWIASGTQQAILQVSPTYASVKEKFASLPLAPHYIAVGETQIMVCDTTANRIAFVKRRNGKVQILEFEGHPGPCIYNVGKFYLTKNDSLVAIYDEQAMTTRAVLNLGMQIDEILLNRYHLIYVSGHNAVSVRQALLDPNGDGLVGGDSYVVQFQKYRPTPYFAARFGREYLRDLSLINGKIVSDNAVTMADSTTDFEVDFFEGTLFYLRDGHLVARNMASDSLLDSLTFQGSLVKAMHQYAEE